MPRPIYSDEEISGALAGGARSPAERKAHLLRRGGDGRACVPPDDGR